MWFARQVLEVVRANYDTLTLKLQDNLDYFEKYTEKAKETAFFTQLVSVSVDCVCVCVPCAQCLCVQVRSVIEDVRENVTVSSLQQASLLNELAVTT